MDFSPILTLTYKLIWQLEINCRGQGVSLTACAGCPGQLAALLCQGIVEEAVVGWWLPPPRPASLCSLTSLLASCIPYCLCVCIYLKLLLLGSKIPLSWTGPTLEAWNVQMLRLALHILSVRDNSSRALKKQINPWRLFSLLSAEKRAEDFGETWNRTGNCRTLFRSVLKDGI